MILVGTCGFQHRDWVPAFYPRSLDPGLWLPYYAGRFSCCELGFTSYRIPEPRTIQQLVEGSGGSLQFVFRAPERLPSGAGDPVECTRSFLSALWPLAEAGQLAGVLVSFGPGFEFHRDNFALLLARQETLKPVLMIAEFGCAAWRTPRAARHLAAHRIGLACVDGEPACATADVAYIKLQGRKRSRWLQGDGSADHDYLYSRAELEALVPQIRRLEDECERVLVFMNNTWRGQAAVNGQMLIELLGV